MRIYERRRNEWWAMKLIKPKFMIFFLSPHTAYPIYVCIKFSDFLINQMSFPHPQLSIFLWCSLLAAHRKFLCYLPINYWQDRTALIDYMYVSITHQNIECTSYDRKNFAYYKYYRYILLKRIMLLEFVNGINTWRGHFRWLCLWSAVMSEWWWKV